MMERVKTRQIMSKHRQEESMKTTKLSDISIYLYIFPSFFTKFSFSPTSFLPLPYKNRSIDSVF